MNRLLTVVLGLSFLVLLIPLSGCEQPRGEIEALKKEFEALKKDQETAKKELGEIKAVLQRAGAEALLQRAGAIPRREPKSVVVSVVSIDDDPFLGEKNAKVTIIDFSDYQ